MSDGGQTDPVPLGGAEKILRGATALTDAARGVTCDLVEAGIIDPTKVVRVAVENAVSAAGTLLLTEATLTDISGPKGRPPERDEVG